MLEIKSYGTQLRYECGLARKFHDEIYDETYDERRMTCNWNNSWSEHDSLDPCIWVQCLYPPLPPPTSNLKLIWDGSPVNFTHNVSYVCKSDDLYFEWDISNGDIIIFMSFTQNYMALCFVGHEPSCSCSWWIIDTGDFMTLKIKFVFSEYYFFCLL